MHRALSIAALLAAGATAAHAQPDDSEPSDVGGERERPDPRWRYGVMIVESASLLIPPAIYYWDTPGLQKEDWELRWDWPSWKEKLFSTKALVLDTNRFEPNAVRHPFTGAGHYQIGRANGWSPWASLALDLAASVYWEYFVEYREDPSINDMACNVIGGILIGEPLFQLAAVGEDGASPWRRALAWVASPFHRAQEAVHLSWIPRALEPAAELDFLLAPAIARFDASTHRPELSVGLDLSAVRDPTYGLPGTGTTKTGLAGWNHEILDVRFGEAPDASGVTGARFRSETTYWASYHRQLDELGTGDARTYALGGSVDLGYRRMRDDWDKLGVFELFGPSVTAFRRTRALAFDATLGAYADVAMVQAFVFPGPPPMTERSVLLNRGYYYASGATAIARARVRGGRWSVSIDSTAHTFWSYDDHSHGGNMDPKGVTDQRLITTARLGVRPTSADLLVGGFADLVVRRGTWAEHTRVGDELDAGLGLTVGF